MFHIPPIRFRRIRHYGISGSHTKQEQLEQCRFLLTGTIDNPNLHDKTTLKPIEEYEKICPKCQKGILEKIKPIHGKSPLPIIFLNERRRFHRAI